MRRLEKREKNKKNLISNNCRDEEWSRKENKFFCLFIWLQFHRCFFFLRETNFTCFSFAVSRASSIYNMEWKEINVKNSLTVMWYIAIHVSLHGYAGIIFFCAFIFFSTCPFSLLLLCMLYSHYTCFQHTLYIRTVECMKRHRKIKYIYFIPDECEKTQIEKNRNLMKKASILLNSFIPSYFPVILLLIYMCVFMLELWVDEI